MEIYVDDVMATSWTSSGTTAAFENVELGVTGATIELRGVLEGSEWLSIMEVSATIFVAPISGLTQGSIVTGPRDENPSETFRPARLPAYRRQSRQRH